MSGRSGYGRSRIVGKIIHKPANMMMAGLAPKVGKPGWAIRLYYQRVNETLTSSVCEPIKIIKRIFVTGNSITDASLTNAGSGAGANANGFLADVGGSPITTARTESQAYYGIIYNRKIDMAPTDVNTPVTGSVIQLTQVDVAGTETPVATLNDNDFKTIIASQLYGTIGTTFSINLGSQTVSASIYTNQNGTPQSWDAVNKTALPSDIQSRLLGFGGGSSAMAYIITNPDKIGGYGILFNITQILNSSFFGEDNAGQGGGSGIRGVKVEPPSIANMQSFRKDVFAMTTTNNNISTTYTPGSLITTEDCFGATVAAPIGGFAIADTTGLPPLQLLA
jgi:hypothetical protein